MLKLVTFNEMQKEVDVEKQNFDTWSKFDQKKVTKNRIFWGNGYSFASTCLGIKSYPWLKLSKDFLGKKLYQKS